MTWSVSTPADNEAVSQGASRIRELKTDLLAALTYEGNFPGADTANPKFIGKIKKDTTANRPAASTDYPGRLYFNTTTQTLQRVSDDGLSWEDLTEADALEAIHAAGETGIVSVGGILTLDETSNCFSATGTEAVTSIAGWSAGLVYIRWATARLLTHNGSTLILRRGVSRNLLAGDVSVFRFTGANSVREVDTFGLGADKHPGEVFMFAGALPSRALECDGASYVRTDYPALFTAIGTGSGAADATHFNVPDMRGRFARGYDHGAGNDPDAASRTAGASGGATGDNVGSIQADAVKAHTHTYSAPVYSAAFSSTGSQNVAVNGPSATQTSAETPTGGNETRPKNVGLMFCIAY